MKNLALAAMASVAFTLSGIAQERKQDEKMSPEQRNELHLKKMAIDLDLNENQQKEMAKIIAEQSANRENRQKEMEANKASGKKLSPDDRFKMKGEMLDKQKAHKDKIRKLLNEKQFEKWEQMQQKRQHKMHEKRKDRRKNNKEKMDK